MDVLPSHPAEGKTEILVSLEFSVEPKLGSVEPVRSFLAV